MTSLLYGYCGITNCLSQFVQPASNIVFIIHYANINQKIVSATQCLFFKPNSIEGSLPF